MADVIHFQWHQNISIEDAYKKIEDDLGLPPLGLLEKAITKLRAQEKNVLSQMIYSVDYDKSRKNQIIVLSLQVVIEAGEIVAKRVKQYWFLNRFFPAWERREQEVSLLSSRL